MTRWALARTQLDDILLNYATSTAFIRMQKIISLKFLVVFSAPCSSRSNVLLLFVAFRRWAKRSVSRRTIRWNNCDVYATRWMIGIQMKGSRLMKAVHRVRVLAMAKNWLYFHMTKHSLLPLWYASRCTGFLLRNCCPGPWHVKCDFMET